MAHASTYLDFDGTTEAAFAFHKSVFATKFVNGIARMGDVQVREGQPELTDEQKQLVVDVALPILGGHVLKGTDATESMVFSLNQGNNVHICLTADSRAEADTLFTSLVDGGAAEMPMMDMWTTLARSSIGTASNGWWYTVVYLLYALFWPAVSCLVLPVAVVLSWIVVGWNLTTLDMPVDTWLVVMALGYVLGFGPSTLIALRYRARSGDISLLQTAVLIHSIGLFQFVWGLAGWRAIWRLMKGQGGWAKTERMIPTAGTPS